jgi:uncharacterized protein YecT (DUF1311 family)
MRRLLGMTAGLAILAGPVFAGAQGDPAEKANDCDGGTLQILQCIGKQQENWDRKLNAAYQAALKEAEPNQRDLLRQSERAWIKFRETNCDYYGAADGSISRINAAACFRDMTEKRARELSDPPYNN